MLKDLPAHAQARELISQSTYAGVAAGEAASAGGSTTI